ncbi:unnamed protein product, partial [Scytosiphon promiscuus]
MSKRSPRRSGRRTTPNVRIQDQEGNVSRRGSNATGVSRGRRGYGRRNQQSARRRAPAVPAPLSPPPNPYPDLPRSPPTTPTRAASLPAVAPTAGPSDVEHPAMEPPIIRRSGRTIRANVRLIDQPGNVSRRAAAEQARARHRQSERARRSLPSHNRSEAAREVARRGMGRLRDALSPNSAEAARE